jgi:hypothetical protein
MYIHLAVDRRFRVAILRHVATKLTYLHIWKAWSCMWTRCNGWWKWTTFLLGDVYQPFAHWQVALPPQPLPIGIKQQKARVCTLIRGAVRGTCVLGHFSKTPRGCDAWFDQAQLVLSLEWVKSSLSKGRNAMNYFTAAKNHVEWWFDSKNGSIICKFQCKPRFEYQTLLNRIL